MIALPERLARAAVWEELYHRRDAFDGNPPACLENVIAAAIRAALDEAVKVFIALLPEIDRAIRSDALDDLDHCETLIAAALEALKG